MSVRPLAKRGGTEVLPYESLGDLYAPLFAKRYEMFVEGRGWRDLERPDHLDIDRYDDARTTYVINQIDAEIVGGARLRPTMLPHMLKNDFSFLCAGECPPSGPDIFECSRTFVARRHPQRRLIFAEILLAAAQFCIERRITKLTGVLETWWLNSYLALGLKATPLGAPQEFENMTLLAVSFEIDEQLKGHLEGVARDLFSGHQI